MTEYTSRLQKIEDVLLKYLPKKSTNIWQNNSFGSLPLSVSTTHFSPLLTPCYNLVMLGGKRWRPLLLVLCAECQEQNHTSDSKSSIQDAYDITPLVEFVHTASLIHDDIEDNADTRRGEKAAHITWGLDTAVNSASWLYFQSAKCIDNLQVSEKIKLQLYQLYTEQLRRLHLGQAMDISWHKDNNAIPTCDEYIAMVSLKTGTLASLAAKAGIIVAGGTLEDANKVGEIAADIGVGFQIIDDVINLTTGNIGKKRGDDIVEGKKSLPILFHIQENPQDRQKIINCFFEAQKNGINHKSVENCIQILNSNTENNAILKAANYGQFLIEQATTKFLKLYPKSDSAILVQNLFAKISGNIKFPTKAN